MISFEDSLKDKPLKLYSKKIDFKFGIPEKIDGPEKIISFPKKMPLEIELEYFIKHLSGKKPDISNIYHGLEVVSSCKGGGAVIKLNKNREKFFPMSRHI